MKRILINVLLYIWQLPQNIIGLIIGLITGFNKNPRGFYSWKLFSGISLGRYIYLHDYCSDLSVFHEMGHQKQSLMLGPLYLLIVGLPSILWCIAHRYFYSNKNYYSFYTEKWADKLSNIDRGL